MIALELMRPLADRVLLRRLDRVPDDSTIIIPDAARTPAHRGKVVSVGPGRLLQDGKRIPMQVKPGDIVCYQTSDFDDGTHILIQEGDILVVEHRDPP